MASKKSTPKKKKAHKKPQPIKLQSAGKTDPVVVPTATVRSVDEADETSEEPGIKLKAVYDKDTGTVMMVPDKD